MKKQGKKIRFKVNKVACTICKKEFPTNTYKSLFPFPKSYLPAHLPEHNCEEA